MAAFHYEFHVNGLQKNSIDVVNGVCLKLADKNGKLTAKNLLEASRDEAAPLHNEFEWDDKVAAEEYRLDQARGIIRNLDIVYEKTDTEEERRVRAYVSIPGGKSEYVALENALSHESWRAHLLECAQRDLKAFMTKYRNLKELAEVTEVITGFLEKAGA